ERLVTSHGPAVFSDLDRRAATRKAAITIAAESPSPRPTIRIDQISYLVMLKATAGKILPTTITGSLPRPSWYTENLGNRSFLDAMVITRFREQYVDALSVYLREQEVAGLDIVTDG